MTRAFNNQWAPNVIMPRLSFTVLILCWTAGLVYLTRAESVYRRSIGINPIDKDDASKLISCECEIFIQSWSSPQLVRLPLGMEEIKASGSGAESSSEVCLQLCQKQLPEQSDGLPVWNKIYKRACWTLLASDDKRDDVRSPAPADGVRGSLQAYSRSSDTHTWMPMGAGYRKILSCSHPRNRRSAPEARKVSTNSGKLNTFTIDAQTALDSSESSTTSSPANQSPATRPPFKRPSKPSSNTPQAVNNKNGPSFNVSTVRTVLKQFGFWGPNVANVFDFLERVGVRQMLERLQLGSYVDRYDRLYTDYTEEFDVGQCVMEHLVYTVFNHRSELNLKRDGRKDGRAARGLRDDALNYALEMTSNFLESEHAPNVLRSVFSKVPSSRISVRSSTDSAADQPNVQDVALNVARFYLRNYLGSLPGNELRSADSDPSNSPDGLADMVEQVSRPLFLSVFGIVPGATASGKLEHLLQVSQERGPESRNKLRLESNDIDDTPYEKTGNLVFDIGNQLVRTFQRASNPTSGLYCLKQYGINKMWDGYRGSMRSMMRSIPSSGKQS